MVRVHRIVKSPSGFGQYQLEVDGTNHPDLYTVSDYIDYVKACAENLVLVTPNHERYDLLEHMDGNTLGLGSSTIIAFEEPDGLIVAYAVTPIDTKAQLVAQEDAEAYLDDCDFEGVDPDSYVSAFGGWDGWAIEGVGYCAFAESITDIYPDEIEELYDAGTLADDERYKRAAGEYATKFAEVVEEAISKKENETNGTTG